MKWDHSETWTTYAGRYRLIVCREYSEWSLPFLWEVRDNADGVLIRSGIVRTLEDAQEAAAREAAAREAVQHAHT